MILVLCNDMSVFSQCNDIQYTSSFATPKKKQRNILTLPSASAVLRYMLTNKNQLIVHHLAHLSISTRTNKYTRDWDPQLIS